VDSSVLLGASSPQIVAGAALGYYQACWSPWIIGEYVRNRIEWAVTRPGWDLVGGAARKEQLEQVRASVNNAVDYLSRVLVNVDCHTAPAADLSWLNDPDDHAIMRTALAAKADALVTDNTTDFPPGKRRNDVLLLDSERFLKTLYEAIPEAEQSIREYLAG
jgi:hypothetical protein